ncbi:MAG: serine hydrolase [Coriobacteriales bacterium]
MKPPALPSRALAVALAVALALATAGALVPTGDAASGTADAAATTSAGTGDGFAASAETDESALQDQVEEGQPEVDWDSVVGDIREYSDRYADGASVEAVVVRDGTVVARYSQAGSGSSSGEAADGEVGLAPAGLPSASPDASGSSDAASSALDAGVADGKSSSASSGATAGLAPATAGSSSDSPDGASVASAADASASSSGDARADDSLGEGVGDRSDSDYQEGQGSIVGQHVTDASEATSYTQLTSSSIVNWGRCSDLLVWASVMQLVEQGRLDLDETVSSELPDGVELPDGAGAITLLDLMNHTTGLNVSTSSNAPVTAQGRSILDAIGLYSATAQFEPGTVVSYSSYDVALAAALVEQASGQDICSYVTQNVLEPLGMDDTAIAAGLSASRMAESSDPRTSEVASRLATVTAPAGASAATLADVIRSITSSLTDASVTGSIDGTALTAIGSTEDLAKLCAALVAPGDGAGLFDSSSTADELFTTTRTFPALGTRRIAHGMFALPTMPAAVGATGLSAGITCAAYMDRTSRTVVVVLVGQSSRGGFAQGVAGAAMRACVNSSGGGGEASQSSASAPSESAPVSPSSASAIGGLAEEEGQGSASAQPTASLVDWTGVYQDAALPTNGPSKLLGYFERTRVDYDVDTDTLTINGTPTTSLGRGVYVTAEPSGNDPYRFHVGLADGLEFSRVTGDSYQVPTVLLVIETALLAGGVCALVVSSAYSVVGVAGALRARIRRTRWRGQKSCLFLSLATTAASWWTFVSVISGETVFLATMPVERVLNAAFCLLACAFIVWICVTRMRGAARGRRSVASAAVACVAAGTIALNFLYWQMLP